MDICETIFQSFTTILPPQESPRNLDIRLIILDRGHRLKARHTVWHPSVVLAHLSLLSPEQQGWDHTGQ